MRKRDLTRYVYDKCKINYSVNFRIKNIVLDLICKNIQNFSHHLVYFVFGCCTSKMNPITIYKYKPSPRYTLNSKFYDILFPSKTLKQYKRKFLMIVE